MLEPGNVLIKAFSLSRRSRRRIKPLLMMLLFPCALSLIVTTCVDAQTSSDSKSSPDTNLPAAQRLYNQADALYSKRQYSEAISLAEQSVKAYLTASETEDSGLARSLNLVAVLYQASRKYGAAEPLFIRAAAILERVKDDSAVVVLTNLARLYLEWGPNQHHKGQQIARRALLIYEQHLGEDDPKVAGVLSVLASLYEAANEYTRAEPLYRRALAIQEKAFGAEHPDVALSLIELGKCDRDMGKYPQAATYYKQALVIFEKTYGPNDSRVATALQYLAALYTDTGEYEKAGQLYPRSLEIKEKIFGGNSPEVAGVLHDLAWLYFLTGQHAKAETLNERALTIFEEVYGQEHYAIAATLNNLALLSVENGAFAKAEDLYNRALVIDQKAFGQENREVATVLSNLALLYRETGDYAKAETLHKRALAIREKVLGAQHPEVANSMNCLGELYQSTDEYAKAELFFQRALAIRENVLGPEHPDTATTLHDLAWIYAVTGDYAKAEQKFQRALAIQKAFGPSSLAVATSLTSLASLYAKNGMYAKAEESLKLALGIRERLLGTMHPYVASVLISLANLYVVTGSYSRAELVYQRALMIDETALGTEHPYTATTLRHLAFVYVIMCNYEKAEPLLQRALTIDEKVFGAQGLSTAYDLDTIAKLYEATGDYDRALTLLLRVADIQEHNIALFLAAGSEQRKQFFLNTQLDSAFSPVSLSARMATTNPLAAQLALTTILRRKGRALDAMTEQIGILRERATREDISLLDQLASVRERLANLAMGHYLNLPLLERQKEIQRLEAETERLENEISRSTELRAVTQPVTLDGVQQALPADAALVEFFSYLPYDPKRGRFYPAHYVAYVLHHTDVPRFVDLGDAAAIDTEVGNFRNALQTPESLDIKGAGRAMDERVMRPIRSLLGQTRHLFLSPDGGLNLIPFGALVDEYGNYLIEGYRITYLTSGRDLLRLGRGAKSRGRPVLLANPLYDLTVTTGHRSRLAAMQSRNYLEYRTIDFASLRYKPLPGTAEEVVAINRLIPDALMLTGSQATEAAIKSVRGPRILHLATHGFFLSSRQREPIPLARQLLPAQDLPRDGPMTENPLLYSGLIFTGVNQRQSGTGEDGVLTALEVAALDLWGTKLVVLSACETGLGDVKNGEGVSGLRRALVLAGSEAQVMSLWKVSDTATRDLMTHYYTRLQKTEGRTEALRQVQLAMLQGQLSGADGGQRDTSDTKEKSAPKSYRHPYYWAAFIQSGDWRSMEGR